MKNHLNIFRIQILVTLLSLSTFSFGQIYAPGRDWAGETKYTKIGVKQDSIFVFFSTVASPRKGNLKAKFPDGSNSNFKWYKYNSSISNINNRFVEFLSENGMNQSLRANLDRGGYKVTVTRVSDLKDTTFFCWVMIDDVVISSLDIYNECDFLEVIAKPLPSALSIQNLDAFRYWDIKSSLTIHSVNNKIGNDYFKNIKWQASNSKVPIPAFLSLTLTIGGPAPLYESKYDAEIINPFGRIITCETSLLPAKAAKADFTLFVDKDGKNTWTEGDNGEALLALKFDTKSINADSIYWNIINDAGLFKETRGDSIIWSEGYKLADGIGIIPSEKLVPGTFPIEHIAYNVTTGCRDTMTIDVKVDSSFIKPDAIPNVFSPNGDSENEYFLIKDAETNMASIKSFKISILSRQGMLVYSYSGNPKEWKGWDGNMDRSKKEAPEGIYFFVIEAKGWDDKSFKRGPYKGFLYLYRGR